MGQPAQPPAQEPTEPPQIYLPAFLSTIIERTIEATMMRRAAATTIDPIFAFIQENMIRQFLSFFKVIPSW
ncbi:MAG: hypothetical protein K5629_05635 [Eubacteriales bacterium]|nr:hypothetical protein [Eubacteriales bacterium]